MEFAGFGPTFEGEVPEQRASGAETGGALGQRLAPLAPLLAIEVVEGGFRLVLVLGLAVGEDLEQSLGCRVSSVAILAFGGCRVFGAPRVSFRLRQRGRVARVHIVLLHT